MFVTFTSENSGKTYIKLVCQSCNEITYAPEGWDVSDMICPACKKQHKMMPVLLASGEKK